MIDLEINEAFKALGLESRQNEGQLLATDFAKVSVTMSENSRELDEKTRQQVEEKWRKHLRSCSNDFEGPLVSLYKIFQIDNVLNLRVRPVSFSVFYATRPEQVALLERRDDEPLDWNYPLPLSVGAVTLTAPSPNYPKGSLIFAKRSKTAFNRDEYTLLPGGYLNPIQDDFIEKEHRLSRRFVSPRLALDREFKEELRFESYKLVQWLGLVFNCIDSKQPLLAVALETPKTAEEVLAFASRGAECENTRIVCVPADLPSLKEFVATHRLCSHDVWKLALWVAAYK